MSVVQRFHEKANDALVQLSEHCLPGAKLILVIHTPGEPERDIVIEDQGLNKNEVLSTLRRRGLGIDGDNAYKRDLCDSIIGALALGAQDRNPPPAEHWAQVFWDIGRQERALCDELLAAAITVLDGLNARIDQASISSETVPVFSGIADLHAAIAKATE
jgi:hypothetical protein